jgi:hypothetical protein
VYRFLETNGKATVQRVVTNMMRPNGLCLSPDETKLYVADSGVTPGFIRQFDVSPEGTVTGGTVLCTVAAGVPDGIKCDIDGRIWSSAEEGVCIIAPDGHLIGRVRLTRTANLCFGGPDYKTLYTVGQPYVYSLQTRVAGAVARKKLNATRSGDDLKLTWPAHSTGFVLQQSDSISESASWSNASAAAFTENDTKSVSVEGADSAKFYRLALPAEQANP